MNIVVGASVALAAKNDLGREHWLRSSALWGLVLLELLVIGPRDAYVLAHYPDWGVMYWFDAAALPRGLLLGLAALPLVAGVGAFALTRRFLLRGKAPMAWLVLGAGVLLTFLLGYANRSALVAVGPRAAFLQPAPSLRPMPETQLFYLLLAGGVGGCLSWGVTLWRLRIVSTASERRPKKASEKRAPSHTPPPKKRKS